MLSETSLTNADSDVSCDGASFGGDAPDPSVVDLPYGEIRLIALNETPRDDDRRRDALTLDIALDGPGVRVLRLTLGERASARHGFVSSGGRAMIEASPESTLQRTADAAFQLVERHGEEDLEEVIEALASTLLVCIKRATQIAAREPDFVSRSIAFVDRNPAKQLSLDAIAREVGCSPFELSKRFHSEFGVGVKAFVTERRAGASRDAS